MLLTQFAIYQILETSWYSDPDVKGLQLCVTKTGTKTWYVNRWDAQAAKTRRVKLGQWARVGKHTAWAKKQVGRVAHDIDEGKAATRQEAADARAGIPTFREAFDEYLTHRQSIRASGKARMLETTAHDYRLSFDKHLSAWADVQVDQLPILAINRHLNALQVEHPHAAHRAAAIAGAVVRFINKLVALALPIPGLLDPTAMKSRVQTGRLDMQVPLATRKAEIDDIENETIRLCWMVTLYTGFRGRSLRSLTWDQVDLDAGTVTFGRLKRQDTSRTIVVADDVIRMFRRLWEISQDDCDWVFPSRRVVGDVRGPLDALDRHPLTSAGDLRHYWMSIARETCDRPVHRWLSQQSMTDDDLRMLGHYGEPTRAAQKAGAEAIASAINAQFKAVPANVVAIAR